MPGVARSATMVGSFPDPKTPREIPPVAQTNSRKANQRRRFQKQRQEVRKRIEELKATAKPQATT